MQRPYSEPKWFDTQEGKESLDRVNRETNDRIDNVTRQLANVFAIAAAEAAGLAVSPETDPVDDLSSSIR